MSVEMRQWAWDRAVEAVRMTPAVQKDPAEFLAYALNGPADLREQISPEPGPRMRGDDGEREEHGRAAQPPVKITHCPPGYADGYEPGCRPQRGYNR